MSAPEECRSVVSPEEYSVAKGGPHSVLLEYYRLTQEGKGFHPMTFNERDLFWYNDLLLRQSEQAGSLSLGHW
jgi:hypothetical protein